MKFNKLSISGSFLIEPELVCDERGIFRRHYCKEEYATHGITTGVLQGNVSENPYVHTLRGFHYQLAPHAEALTSPARRTYLLFPTLVPAQTSGMRVGAKSPPGTGYQLLILIRVQVVQILYTFIVKFYIDH